MRRHRVLLSVAIKSGPARIQLTQQHFENGTANRLNGRFGIHIDRMQGLLERSGSRREFLRRAAYLSLALPISRSGARPLAQKTASPQKRTPESGPDDHAQTATLPVLTTLSADDEKFLDALERA